MMDEKKIGIVTVLYNSEKVLDDFFDSLKRQTYKNFILYVIDNFSPDKSLEKARNLASECSFETKFIANKENYGVAKGNNQGIIYALHDGCDYVLLSNNDVVLEDDTIRLLCEGLRETGADMAVPKIYLHDSARLWCAGGKFSRLNDCTVHFGYDKADGKRYSRIRRVAYAPTCFMLIDKSVFHDVGLMDEKYFVYYDDTDFVYRARKAHKRLFYIPEATMRHKESVCTGKHSDFFYRYIYRNRIYFMSKTKRVWKVKYFIHAIFNKTIRKFRMRDNKEQYEIVTKALKEGYMLGGER